MRPHELVERAVSAQVSGDVAAIAEVTSETDLRWANSMLTTNGERSSTRLTVVRTVPVPDGVAVGMAAGNASTAHDIDELLAQAAKAAEQAGAAADAMPFAERTDHAHDWAELAPSTGAAEMAGLAADLGDAFLRGRSDGLEHFGYAEHQVTTAWLGTSGGTRLRHVQPTARVEMTAKSHGRSRSAWAGRSGRSMSEVAVGPMDADLRRGLEWQARTIDLKPGRHDAVLTPSAVSDLLVYLYWSASARDAAEGRTVFSAPGGGTRLGEQLWSPALTLSSNPHDPELACVPFSTAAWSSGLSSVFDLGVQLESTTWLDSGRLASLVSSRSTAAAQGSMPSPMIDNLRLEHAEGSGSLDDLVARTGEGILITCLWYIREVDPRTLLLTGLTRDGVYLVSGGEVVGTVGNFRFNTSPVDLFAGVADAGATECTLPREWGDYFARAAAPPLLVEGLNLSTRSDAL